MATLSEQRTELIARITSLQSRVTHGDKTVEFDLSAARMALDIVDQEIVTAAGTSVTRNITLASRGKSL